MPTLWRHDAKTHGENNAVLGLHPLPGVQGDAECQRGDRFPKKPAGKFVGMKIGLLIDPISGCFKNHAVFSRKLP
ncbi:hypothetical protein XSR1_410009 [Xenorhabdus szentirmaii DSM 16338]|uniref:Uncharacterized protein n=1 Tax=Xenorhabdus szentirmaii DSM 16338 TaxID=1427518 RepID=W1J2A8_9GAMM|nr:hypothetical protein XSR1_410009 [Xenorhabdus szentirmaii DSM 16338]